MPANSRWDLIQRLKCKITVRCERTEKVPTGSISLLGHRSSLVQVNIPLEFFMRMVTNLQNLLYLSHYGFYVVLEYVQVAADVQNYSFINLGYVFSVVLL